MTSGHYGLSMWSRRLCTSALCCVAALLIYTEGFALLSSQAADAVQVHVRTTRVQKSNPADPVIVEMGTYLIARDGRYRVDKRTPRGEHVAEIVDYRSNRVVKLDLKGRQAIIGSNRAYFAGPGVKGPVPGGPPSGLSPSSDMVDLGERVVSGVTLRGVRQTNVFSATDQSFVHTMELWNYTFPDPRIPPILVEQRFEGPDEIVETRIEQVESTIAADDAFAIPRNFTVVTLGR